MGPSSLFFIFLPVLFLFLAPTAAQPELSCAICNNTRGNYTSTSTYSENLKTLLSAISSSTQINNGFVNFSVGEKSDKVYGIAVCTAADCHSCVNDATKRLQWDCPTQKEAVGFYYSKCMFRYSDRPIFGIMEDSPTCFFNTPGFVPDPDAEKFNETLVSLLDTLRNKAAAGGSHYKLASGDADVTASLKIYAQTQCSPDLTPSNCSTCLQRQISHLRSCCSRIRGSAIYAPSCTVKFENYPFVTGSWASSTTSLPPTSSFFSPPSVGAKSKPGKRRGTYKTLIIIAVAFVLFLLLAILCFCFSKRRVRKNPKRSESYDQMKCVDTLLCEFDEIKLATDNFSDVNRLKKGISGEVYKGVLPNGQEIVVKKICKKGRNGELEFNNEVQLLANLQHKNLVKLVGFCIRKDSGLLMYEFQPNGSLDQFIYDPIKRTQLDWGMRHKIILGTARALLYLHEDSQLMVIHRDLKASTILLGAEMNPKISNFSKAIMVHADQPRGGSSTIKGTYGYIPPEYVLQGHFSIKSDVFSFGVLLLEIISGESISSFSDAEGQDLLSFAWRKWSEDEALQVVDQTIQGIEIHTAQIMRCIEIALLCVQEDPTCRPTMSTVVFMLNSDTISKAEPSRPASVIWPQ